MYHHQSGWALEPTDRMVRWHQHPKSGRFSSGPWLAGTRIYPFWIFGDKGDGGGGNNWSYTMRKAPVKIHHQQTNTQFFTGRMPFLTPNQQCQSTEGKTTWFYIM